MRTLRIVGAVASFAAAVALASHLVAAGPMLMPTIRELGQEQTTFFIMHVGGWTLVGRQILAFESGVAILMLVAGFTGVYLLAPKSDTG